MELEQSGTEVRPAEVVEGSSPDALKADVAALAVDIGERNVRDEARYRRLLLARDFIGTRMSMMGLLPRLQRYEAGKREVANLEVELRGHERPDEIVIVGAHYDTAVGSPGANDNATGVAALLALARALSRPGGFRPARTLRFLAFSTEEQPFTRTAKMGSSVYARRCRFRREQVVAMLSLETLGYYYQGAHAPEAPFPLSLFSPFRGNFVAVVGNLRSRALVRQLEEAFPQDDGLRCHGVALPGTLPAINSSDHWSFWKEGYPAVMVTDTAFLRYRHYHRPTDTLDRLDFETLSRVVGGLEQSVRALVGDAGSRHA